MERRALQLDSITMGVVEVGAGAGRPLVVLLHGFPETADSWRHQVQPLADAGFHVVAPDQRGFGATSAPDDVADYSMLHLVGDVVSLIGALGASQAVVVGHDWGAPVAWNTALLRPDLVRGVVGMSVPFLPPGPVDILTALDLTVGPHHYQRWFQGDAATEELDADPRRGLLAFYGALSGHDGDPHDLVLGEGRSLLDALPAVDEPPPWMTDEHLDHLVESFTASGFRGGLNWYRTAAINQPLLRPWTGKLLEVPAAFITGELDVVHRWPGMSDAEALLPAFAPRLVRSEVLEGCGHWTAEERPDEVTTFLLEVLAAL